MRLYDSDAERQSGRTTRMLDAAVAEAASGSQVVIVGADVHHCDELRTVYRERAAMRGDDIREIQRILSAATFIFAGERSYSGRWRTDPHVFVDDFAVKRIVTDALRRAGVVR